MAMKNVGILGFAHGHVFSYACAWNENPDAFGVRVTGGWDADDARLATSIQKFPGAQAYASVDALLASDIQAVVVSSETAYHAELCERAARAKKDIILYKPMALNMKEADRIVNAVNQNGVRLSMGWQMRTDPQNARMRALVKSGELGAPSLFRRRHGLATQTWANFDQTWHVNPALNRDIFADDSAHPIDMMHWMFGMPESVSCEMSTTVNPKVVNDTGVALFKYDSGMIAEISLCFVTVASEITTEIYLSGGSIQQYYGDAVSTYLPRASGLPGLKWYKTGDKDWTDSGIPSPAAHGARLKDQARTMADFINGGPAVCTAEEGRDSLRLVMACYLSAREGKRVSVYDDRIYDI